MGSTVQGAAVTAHIMAMSTGISAGVTLSMLGNQADEPGISHDERTRRDAKFRYTAIGTMALSVASTAIAFPLLAKRHPAGLSAALMGMSLALGAGIGYSTNR